MSLEGFKTIISYNQLEIDNMGDERIFDKFNRVKQLQSHIDPSKFISMTPYQTLIVGSDLYQGHPVADGHKKISDIVIKFLQREYHGKKKYIDKKQLRNGPNAEKNMVKIGDQNEAV
jgi:hypothetical protein